MMKDDNKTNTDFLQAWPHSSCEGRAGGSDCTCINAVTDTSKGTIPTTGGYVIVKGTIMVKDSEEVKGTESYGH
jgi:hypothetical protein